LAVLNAESRQAGETSAVASLGNQTLENHLFLNAYAIETHALIQVFKQMNHGRVRGD
jgi:hypothetical protein